MGSNMKEKWTLLKYLLVQSLASKAKEWFLSLHYNICKKIRTCPLCGGLLIFVGHLPRNYPEDHKTMKHNECQNRFPHFGCLDIDNTLLKTPQENSILWRLFLPKANEVKQEIALLFSFCLIMKCKNRLKKAFTLKKFTSPSKKSHCFFLFKAQIRPQRKPGLFNRR